MSSNNGESAQTSVAVAMAVGIAGINIALEAACSFVYVGLVDIVLIFFFVCVGTVCTSVLEGFQICFWPLLLTFKIKQFKIILL